MLILLRDKNLLTKGYSLLKFFIYIYITYILTEWILFEMDYQVDRKVMEMVTVSEEMPITVSKTKWN
jgi:hypothetical protein